MATIENNLFDIRTMDTLASGSTGLHRLDPRAKLITTLIFIVMVVSLGKYEISMMIPFVIYPVAMVVGADLPTDWNGPCSEPPGLKNLRPRKKGFIPRFQPSRKKRLFCPITDSKPQKAILKRKPQRPGLPSTPAHPCPVLWGVF